MKKWCSVFLAVSVVRGGCGECLQCCLCEGSSRNRAKGGGGVFAVASVSRGGAQSGEEAFGSSGQFGQSAGDTPPRAKAATRRCAPQGAVVCCGRNARATAHARAACGCGDGGKKGGAECAGGHGGGGAEGGVGGVEEGRVEGEEPDVWSVGFGFFRKGDAVEDAKAFAAITGN